MKKFGIKNNPGSGLSHVILIKKIGVTMILKTLKILPNFILVILIKLILIKNRVTYPEIFLFLDLRGRVIH